MGARPEVPLSSLPTRGAPSPVLPSLLLLLLLARRRDAEGLRPRRRLAPERCAAVLAHPAAAGPPARAPHPAPHPGM